MRHARRLWIGTQARRFLGPSPQVVDDHEVYGGGPKERLVARVALRQVNALEESFQAMAKPLLMGGAHRLDSLVPAFRSMQALYHKFEKIQWKMYKL